jgi:MFS family permease
MIEKKKINQRSTASQMRIFIFIWLGQMVSLIGSGLTDFALGVWVYQHTSSVTQYTLVSLSVTVPFIVISPIAGIFVDRWDRRWTMFLSDSGASFSTLILALLFLTGQIKIWHICLARFISSICQAFQSLAYSAATTLLVPKQLLGRANGLLYLGLSVAEMLSPLLAGVLVVLIQIHGVLLLDFATFFFALITLLVVRFPTAKSRTTGIIGKASLLHEAAYAWTYIKARPGLLGLVIFLAVTNFLMGIVVILTTPLVLSFASTAVLGTVLFISSSGMVVSSLLITIWGGPQRLTKSIFGFMLLSGLCILVAGFRPNTWLFSLSAFLFFFGQPFITGSIQVIFQRKVVPDLQGKVFALTKMLAGLFLPLAYLVAGPLADRIFEPLLDFGGPLSESIGQIIGVGRGRGIGLMFIVIGTFTILVTIVTYQYSRLRLVEDELPDVIAGSTAKQAKNQTQDPTKTD